MFLCLALVLAVVAPSQTATRCGPDPVMVARADAILAELASLPDGIVVEHAPDVVKAEPWTHGEYRIKWEFATRVAPGSGSVRIVEFGCLSWFATTWVFANYTGEPFGTTEFAAWYGCPDGLMSAGGTYADSSNWHGADRLAAGKGLWYFIGIDEDGRRVKGRAEVAFLPAWAE